MQVWFQNRRQRSKAAAPGQGDEEAQLAANGAVSDLLNAAPEHSHESLLDFGRICASMQGGGGSSMQGLTREGVGAFPSSALGAACGSNGGAGGGGALLECETFDWALPNGSAPGRAFSPEFGHGHGQQQQPLSGVKRSGSEALLGAPSASGSMHGGGMAALSALGGGAVDNGAASSPAPSGVRKPASLGALLGLACHVLGLDGADYWRVGAGAHPQLLQCYLPATGGARKATEVSACRSLLAAALCEQVMQTRDMLWFGMSAEQQAVFEKAGVAVRQVLAVPCPAAEAPALGGAAPVPGVIILYSSSRLEQSEGVMIVARLLGCASAAADLLSAVDEQRTQQLLAAQQPAPVLPSSFAALPAHAGRSSMDWLLLSVANALRVDVAEHWRVHRSAPGPSHDGVVMSLEQMLAGDSVQTSPQLVRDIGLAEAAHPFSSQMCRATFYACKYVWCHATAANGVLEGLQLPMSTSVGLPICDRSGAVTSVLVVYALRRLDETAEAVHLLARLQLLAAACEEFSPQLLDAATHANTHTAATPSTGAVCAHSSQQQQQQQQQQLNGHGQQQQQLNGAQQGGMGPGAMLEQLQGHHAHQQAHQQLQQQILLLQQQQAHQLQQQRQAQQLQQQQRQAHQAALQQQAAQQQQAAAAQQEQQHQQATAEVRLVEFEEQQRLHQQQQPPAGSEQPPAQIASQRPPSQPQDATDELLKIEPTEQRSTYVPRPSSAPPCPVEQLAAGARAAQAGDPCAASVDIPSALLGAGCGTVGLDMSADQVSAHAPPHPPSPSAPATSHPIHTSSHFAADAPATHRAQVLSLLDDIRWPVDSAGPAAPAPAVAPDAAAIDQPVEVR